MTINRTLILVWAEPYPLVIFAVINRTIDITYNELLLFSRLMHENKSE